MELNIRVQLEKDGFIKINKPNLRDDELIDISNVIGLPVESRIGGYIIDRLSPKKKESAYKNSLSNIHELNSFPLHSDTAYYKIPVKYIMLYCKNPGTGGRPTYLYDTYQLINTDEELRFKLTNTIYKVINGRNSFLTTLYNLDTSFFRFDRDCMRSTTSEGEELLKEIDSLIQKNDIQEVKWSLGDLLIIDNWRFLHGRGSSKSEDFERLLYRISIRER